MASFDIKSRRKRRWLRFGSFCSMMLWAYPITQHGDLLVPLVVTMLFAYLCGNLDG